MRFFEDRGGDRTPRSCFSLAQSAFAGKARESLPQGVNTLPVERASIIWGLTNSTVLLIEWLAYSKLNLQSWDNAIVRVVDVEVAVVAAFVGAAVVEDHAREVTLVMVRRTEPPVSVAGV